MSTRSDGLRRVALTLSVYVAVGAGIWFAIPWFQRLLLLPTLFPVLARVCLVLGIPVAALAAWRYPEMGDTRGDG